MRDNWRFNDRELAALGYVRGADGLLLDNRDGFFSDHPDDFLDRYDRRKSVAISRDLLDKLVDAFFLVNGGSMAAELVMYLAVSRARRLLAAGTDLIEGAQIAAAAYGVPYSEVLSLASRAYEACQQARMAIVDEESTTG